MSTIVVSNISDGTTTVGASYVTNGSAKAWVNFNGTGTIAARDSLNVSSMTDLATGRYQANFSNVFGAGDYSAIVTPRNDNGAITATLDNTDNFSDYIVMRVWSVSPALTDVATACITCHGDLA